MPCAAPWERAVLGTEINEARTPGSQSLEPQRRRETEKVIVLQGKECLQSGPISVRFNAML